MTANIRLMSSSLLSQSIRTMSYPAKVARQSGHKKLVLCIDDHRQGLHARSLVLQSAGYDVITASSGRIGLQLLGHHPVSTCDLGLWHAGDERGGRSPRDQAHSSEPPHHHAVGTTRHSRTYLVGCGCIRRQGAATSRAVGIRGYASLRANSGGTVAVKAA